MMPVDTNTLKTLYFFAEFTPAEIQQINPIVSNVKVIEGEILTNKNSPAHTFFINLTGNFMLSYEKDRAITLHNKSDLMGLSTVVAPFRYTCTATALTEGEVLSIPGQDFRQHIQENSELGDKIMKKIRQIVADRAIFATGAETTDES